MVISPANDGGPPFFLESNSMTDSNRRKFVTYLGAGAVAIPVSALVGTLPSHAADMLDPASPRAMGLSYVEASETEGQNCANCSIYTGGEESGPCSIFLGEGGGDVTAAGWCTAWTAKG